ncbi:hypothetical protein NL676_008028 [Syzygium grande]|nr:hypothetical protein NL676_008028 [Syzygium grande]
MTPSVARLVPLCLLCFPPRYRREFSTCEVPHELPRPCLHLAATSRLLPALARHLRCASLVTAEPGLTRDPHRYLYQCEPNT